MVAVLSDETELVPKFATYMAVLCVPLANTGADPGGSEYTIGLPMPATILDCEAGVKDTTWSTCAGLSTLPALGTKTREFVDRIAAWVGLNPMLAAPMVVSPETSIWTTDPGLAGVFALTPKTA